MKASIVIANYNNSKYINECIKSLHNQTYKDIEIIFFDDNSKDNSLEVIKKFENIKIIENKIQSKFGSFNQINAFQKCINISSGDIIFFLDSDDFFKNNKIEKIMQYYLNNKNKNIVFDYPIIKKDNGEIFVKKKINFFKTYWGYIHPTSCISVRRNFVDKLFNIIVSDNFENIWLDLRILLFSKYLNEYNIVNDNLTFYRQFEGNESSKFKKYSKNWWKRRNEAHNYFLDFKIKNNLKVNKNLDFYITKILNNFL
tara:strand:+ start:442 stop:1209 length:768 start_codon:yes stop_codon:yes gene_type:complete